MSKRSFKRRGATQKKKKPSAGGMMAQMQKMQEDMAKAQKELENEMQQLNVEGGSQEFIELYMFEREEYEGGGD